MYKVLRLILLPIKEQKVFFCFLLLMSCLVIPTLCYATGAFPKPFVWAPPIFDCYLLALLACVLSRIRLSWLVWVVCFLLLGGEVFSLLVYQSPYSMTVLGLLLETDSREAGEFLMGHGVWGRLSLAAVITVAAAASCFSAAGRLVQWRVPRRVGITAGETPAYQPSAGETPAPQSSAGETPAYQLTFHLFTFFTFSLFLVSAACQGYSYWRLYQSYTADVTSRIS